MSTIHFNKYHGTGNDFIMMDNRSKSIQFEPIQIQSLCDRRFGIGADGLILINKSEQTDFYVDYYNADGSQSFCGNGTRCAIAFAHRLGIIKDKTSFEAIDGKHRGVFYSTDCIELEMRSPKEFRRVGDDYFIDTGSPHYISFCDNLSKADIISFGKTIRFSEGFKEKGVNVNLVQQFKNELAVLTYERGVEDETYSCGTGAVAAAMVYAYVNKIKKGTSKIKVKGGELEVTWKSEKNPFDKVSLIGPAKDVFEGIIQL